MTERQAIKKAVECVGAINVDYCVNVNDGWVIMGELMPQCLYITDSKTKGLNPSIEEEDHLIAKAISKVENGDY